MKSVTFLSLVLFSLSSIQIDSPLPDFNNKTCQSRNVHILKTSVSDAWQVEIFVISPTLHTTMTIVIFFFLPVDVIVLLYDSIPNIN